MVGLIAGVGSQLVSKILTPKPGGTFLGNLTRKLGLNKTHVPGFSGAVNQNSLPVSSAIANSKPIGINPNSPAMPTNTSAGATVGVSGKDFYILLAIVAAFVLLRKKIGL